jgi:hypothetical protein
MGLHQAYEQEERSTQIKYLLGGPMAVETFEAVQDSVEEENGDIPYEKLSHKLSNNKAELWPLYRSFGNQQPELNAIKYAYVLAMESPDIPLPDHLIPMSTSFTTSLLKVCKYLALNSVDILNRSIKLRPQLEQHDSGRITGVSSRAAQHAEETGLDDLDKIPAEVMSALQNRTPGALANGTGASSPQVPSASSDDGYSTTHSSADESEDDDYTVDSDRRPYPIHRRRYVVLSSSSSSSSSSESPSRSNGMIPSPTSQIDRRKPSKEMTVSTPRSRVTRLLIGTKLRESKRPKTRKAMIEQCVRVMKKNKKVLQGRNTKTRVLAAKNNARILRCLFRSEQLHVRSSRRVDKLLKMNDLLEAIVLELLRKPSAIEKATDDGKSVNGSSEHEASHDE